MIIPVYKPIGASTHQLAHQWGRAVGEKATHTGTLDPMADGVIVIVTGEDRFNKAKHSDGLKHYDTTLLLGVQTDTDDMLGLVQQTTVITHTAIPKVVKKLNELQGKITLPIHSFSAKREQGTAYFELAKRDIPFARKQETVEIYAVQVEKEHTVRSADLLKIHKNKINTVSGDFRQEEILKSWNSSLLQLPKAMLFQLITVSIVCSKRTYIRSIARFISEQTNVPLTLFSLTRTKNGPYGISDCLCLI